MSGYQPETGTSPKLKSGGVTHYQEMVRVPRWAVYLGQLDIFLEIALMSTYLALPRSGHLEQILHVFRYLKANLKRNLCFDLQHPTIYERLFAAHDWYDFYRDAK